MGICPVGICPGVFVLESPVIPSEHRVALVPSPKKKGIKIFLFHFELQNIVFIIHMKQNISHYVV